MICQSLFSLLVISWFLTTISVCGGSLSLFSVDGGPLTDNVVLSSVQRVLVLKRTAELLVYSGSFCLRSGTCLCETKTDRTKCDWPALAAWLLFCLLPKAALRPGVIFASLASRHVLSRHCDLGRSCPALRLMFYSSITSRRSRNLNTIVDQ